MGGFYKTLLSVEADRLRSTKYLAYTDIFVGRKIRRLIVPRMREPFWLDWLLLLSRYFKHRVSSFLSSLSYARFVQQWLTYRRSDAVREPATTAIREAYDVVRVAMIQTARTVSRSTSHVLSTGLKDDAALHPELETLVELRNYGEPTNLQDQEAHLSARRW